MRVPVVLHCLALLVLAAPIARAQDAANAGTHPEVSLGGTELRTITSARVPGQIYNIQVNLPRSYANPATRSTYPVLYVLDGQWDFHLISAVYGGHFYDGFVPEMIIVGITWGGERPNVDSLRARDFSPTHEDRLPQSGGAAAFLSFIKDELIPFIEAEYPVRADDRALMGSSFGGLFTLYAMFHETDLFKRYMVSAPAIQWDDQVMARYEAEYAARHTDLPARVFMTLGEYENVEAFDRFAATLRGRGYPGLELATHVVKGTGHAGHKPEGYNIGMQFLYKRPSLALPADVLDAYAGTYRDGDDVIEVLREGDHLVGRQHGQGTTRLHAESPEDFYIEGAHLFIHFEKQGSEVSGFRVRTYNEERFLERVKG